MSVETQFWSRIAQPVQHDTNNLAFTSRGVLCLAAGDINFVTSTGFEDTITVTADMAAAGFMVPCYVKQIKATLTTIADADMRIGT